MPISARLKKYCKDNNITQESLVHKGFGTKQTINNYLNGKTEVKAGFLEMFVKEFRLSANWLLMGDGPVIFETPHHGNLGDGNPKLNTVEEEAPKYPCPDCTEKQKEIDSLLKQIKLLEDNNFLLNELLERYREEAKKEKASENSAQAG